MVHIWIQGWRTDGMIVARKTSIQSKSHSIATLSTTNLTGLSWDWTQAFNGHFYCMDLWLFCVYVNLQNKLHYFGDTLHFITHINVNFKKLHAIVFPGYGSSTDNIFVPFLDIQSKDGWQDVSLLKKSHSDKIHVMCIIVYIFSCVIGYWLTSRSKMLVYVSVYIDTLSYSLCNIAEALIRMWAR
jgi:hypothetical protein